MSILDKVRQSKFVDEISQFNPTQSLNKLLSKLAPKEKEVLMRRYGLLGAPKETLEQIGGSFNLTRERIRQIERLGIKKIKDIDELQEELKKLEWLVTQLLTQHGGVMAQEHFLETFANYLEKNEENLSALLFLMTEVLTEKVQWHGSNQNFHDLWRLKEARLEFLEQVIGELTKIIQENSSPLKLQELLDRFKRSEFYQKNKSQFLALNPLGDEESLEKEIEKITHTYLRATKKVKKNLFDEWGLSSWGSVNPKRINDKIYLVLKRAGKPMHFTEIARLINEAKFDSKVAYPATTHNELILDPKYVLVGRGIYALKEWGYQKGTVAEVIAEILKQAGKPMTKQEIMNKVLAQRQVKVSTVYLALMNKKRFARTSNGEFHLAEDLDISEGKK